MSPNVVSIFDCSVRWLRRTCHRSINVVLIVAMVHLLSSVEWYHAEVLQMIDFYGDRINRMAFGHHSNRCHLKGVARHFASAHFLVSSSSRFLSDFCFFVGAATVLRSKHFRNSVWMVWICWRMIFCCVRQKEWIFLLTPNEIQAIDYSIRLSSDMANSIHSMAMMHCLNVLPQQRSMMPLTLNTNWNCLDSPHAKCTTNSNYCTMCYRYDCCACKHSMHTTKMIVADLMWSNFSQFSIYHHEWAGTASTVVRLLCSGRLAWLVCMCVGLMMTMVVWCVVVLLLELVMHVECDQFV